MSAAVIHTFDDQLPALEVSGVSKRFQIFESSAQRLRYGMFEAPPNVVGEKWALRNVSFTLKRGGAYGIIGRNGSGKSTLLKIICGVMRPTEGQVLTRGRVLGLLELGTGLNMELSGRQNVYASTSLLGFPRSYAVERMAEIESFADIGEFFDSPIKLYSSGMLMRLAFSLYLYMEPDILIVDEALSVGDQFFQRKCTTAMNDIRARGTTLLFVSHSLGTVKAICDRALLLEEGVPLVEGDVDDVINTYLYPDRKPSAQRSSGDVSEAGTATNQPVADAEPDAGAVLARQIIDDLVSEPPSEPPAQWHVAAQRLLDDKDAQASLFHMGAPLLDRIVLLGPGSNPPLRMLVELLDRFDRVITGQWIDLSRATILPCGQGHALVVTLGFRADVVAGEYVLRLSFDAAAALPATLSAPITVYNSLPFPPFHGIVGLPAAFTVESAAPPLGE